MRRKLADESGFTLVERLAAVVILMLGGDLLALDFQLLIRAGSSIELILFHQDLFQIQLISARPSGV